jgi:ASC-1-like (ASCH) protein
MIIPVGVVIDIIEVSQFRKYLSYAIIENFVVDLKFLGKQFCARMVSQTHESTDQKKEKKVGILTLVHYWINVH